MKNDEFPTPNSEMLREALEREPCSEEQAAEARYSTEVICNDWGFLDTWADGRWRGGGTKRLFVSNDGQTWYRTKGEGPPSPSAASP